MTIMVNRRERVRAATVQEIKEVARRQLVTEGPAAVSLRAIAREMGMTAPALYRYFPSFEHLVQALINDIYDEACQAIEKARNDGSQPHERLLLFARAFRTWAVTHRAEYGLLFGAAMPGVPTADPSKAGAAAQTPVKRDNSGDIAEADGSAGAQPFGGALQLEMLFLATVAEVWEQKPYPTPAPDDLASGLVEQLSRYRESIKSQLPLGALAVAIGSWTRLHGLVSLEVFNHLRFAWRDNETQGEPFFEQQLQGIMRDVGSV